MKLRFSISLKYQMVKGCDSCYWASNDGICQNYVANYFVLSWDSSFKSFKVEQHWTYKSKESSCEGSLEIKELTNVSDEIGTETAEDSYNYSSAHILKLGKFLACWYILIELEVVKDSEDRHNLEWVAANDS